MTADGLLIYQTLFSQVWRLFTTWYIPGTRVTPAAMSIFVLAFGLAWRRIKSNMTDGGGDD